MRDLNDLRKLISISKNHFTKLTFEATVDTGFEHLAYEECIEKFGKNVLVSKTRGRIFFNTQFKEYEKYNDLRSVDHVNILAGYHRSQFVGSKNDDLEKIKAAVHLFDWEKALTIWKDVNQFQGILFPDVEDYNFALDSEKERIVHTNKGTRYGFDEDYLHEHRKKNIEKKALVFKTENEPKTPLSDLELALDCVKDIDEEKDAKGTTNCEEEKMIPKFRVTCNRTGDGHGFTSMDAAWVFGGELHDKFNWLIDLKNHNLEVILEIVENDIYVGISLNRLSKHFRNINYFSFTTLRATICYNMLRLCEPRIGDIIVDPLCGGGSIPIEGCFAYPWNYYICGDENRKAVNKVINNINHLKYSGNLKLQFGEVENGLPLQVEKSVESQNLNGSEIIIFDESKLFNKNMKLDGLYWDATRLPLKNNSVDIFVTDLPFGKRSGSRSNNKLLYRKVLEDLARVVRTSSGRSVFLTHDKKCFIRSYQATQYFWKQTKMLNVNIGGLEAGCFVLQRTEKEFEVRLSKSERKKLAKLEWLRKKQHIEES